MHPTEKPKPSADDNLFRTGLLACLAIAGIAALSWLVYMMRLFNGVNRDYQAHMKPELEFLQPFTNAIAKSSGASCPLVVLSPGGYRTANGYRTTLLVEVRYSCHPLTSCNENALRSEAESIRKLLEVNYSKYDRVTDLRVSCWTSGRIAGFSWNGPLKEVELDEPTLHPGRPKPLPPNF